MCFRHLTALGQKCNFFVMLDAFFSGLKKTSNYPSKQYAE